MRWPSRLDLAEPRCNFINPSFVPSNFKLKIAGKVTIPLINCQGSGEHVDILKERVLKWVIQI
jgi:hypothetical protein